MSLDYKVLCRDRPESTTSDWRYDGSDIAHVWVEPQDEFTGELAARFDVDASLIVGLNCHYSASEYVDELAWRLAKTCRGVVWCDHDDEPPLYDFKDSERVRPLPSLDEIADDWADWATPKVEEKRAEAQAKKRRERELYERAQSGESVEGGWDWGLGEDS